MSSNLVRRFYELCVSEIQDSNSWELPVVEVTDSMDIVMNMLVTKDHAWVVQNRRSMKLIGIITEKDFLDVIAPPRIPTYSFGIPRIRSLKQGNVLIAGDIMCRKTLTIDGTCTVKEAIEKMIAYRVRRLAIVDRKKRITGELTLHTLMHKYSKARTYHNILDDTKKDCKL